MFLTIKIYLLYIKGQLKRLRDVGHMRNRSDLTYSVVFIML